MLVPRTTVKIIPANFEFIVQDKEKKIIEEKSHSLEQDS